MFKLKLYMFDFFWFWQEVSRDHTVPLSEHITFYSDCCYTILLSLNIKYIIKVFVNSMK